MSNIRFIGVARDGSMTGLITVGQMIAARGTFAGFWRIRHKPSIQKSISAGGSPQERQGGGKSLLSPPLPAALATRLKPCAERDGEIAKAYLAGDSCRAIRERLGISSDGTIYAALDRLGIARRGHQSKPTNSPLPPRQREATTHEAVSSEEVTLGEDRMAPEGDRDSSRITASTETPESQPVHVNPVAAEAAAERVAPVSQPAVAQARVRDWITQRKEEIASATAFLKTHNIAVSVSNPHAEIKMFRLSDRGGQHYHESVLDAARALGWEGLI